MTELPPRTECRCPALRATFDDLSLTCGPCRLAADHVELVADGYARSELDHRRFWQELGVDMRSVSGGEEVWVPAWAYRLERVLNFQSLVASSIIGWALADEEFRDACVSIVDLSPDPKTAKTSGEATRAYERLIAFSRAQEVIA